MTSHKHRHFEIDLVEGSNHKSHLLTVVDRNTLFTLVYKVKSKAAADINKKIRIPIRELFKKGIPVKTISSDNGSKFAYFKVTESFFDINWYFYDPYKSCQRACNERINSVVRIIFPKTTDFTHISDDVITNKCKCINTIKRARLDKTSPNEVIKSLTS